MSTSALPASPARSALRTTLIGLAFAVLACACFATLDTATQYVSQILPLCMALWMRYLVQSVLTTAVLLPREGRSLLRTRQPGFQVLRAICFATTSLFAFLSLQHMPLAEFTAIVALTPVVVTLCAALWLRQRVPLLRWLLVLLGFGGTLLVVGPSQATLGWALLFPLGLLATGAAYQILTSQMAGRESSLTTHFYTGWIATALTTLPLPLFFTLVDDWRVWLAAFVMGLASSIGHLLLLQAYARARPATIAPFLYSQIGFAMLAGWLFHDHLPGHQALLGMAAIVASGVASTWLTVRESR